MYGIGGSANDVCNLLREWRKENTAALKEGKNEKDLVSAILESVDDGLVTDEEIPEEFLSISKQIALATYRLAYQNADTAISGDRLRQLTAECDVLRQQLSEFPKIQLELDFYQKQYDRQQVELKQAYMQLNQQQLADSQEFQQRLDLLSRERNDLEERLAVAQAKNKELEAAEHNTSTLSGELTARENELAEVKLQLTQVHEQLGEKQALEKQLAETKLQLDSANQTIIQLQSNRVSEDIQVDVDIDSLLAEKEEWELKFNHSQRQLSLLQKQLSISVIPETDNISDYQEWNSEGDEYDDSNEYDDSGWTDDELTVDLDLDEESESNSSKSKSQKQKQTV
jgi:chromosome segregation ATPase